MAITINADWTEHGIGETGPGSPVMTDPTGDDLEALAQSIHKGQAENVRSVLAQGGFGDGMGIDEAGVDAGVDRYRGDTLTWSASVRVRFHVYGQNVEVGGTLGGVRFPSVTCGASRAWYSSAVFRVSGMTRGADGETVVVIWGMDDSGAGTREHEWWILEEVADELAYLPDSSHASTDFQRVDDTAFAADVAFDGWSLATLSRNSREVQRVRSRGTALVHPIADPPTFSSIHRRADGPYTYTAAPWESEGIAIVRCAALDYDVQVAAFTEFEDDAAIDARIQTVTVKAGETVLVFTGLRLSTLGQTTAVYVHLQSAIAPADTAYSPSTISRIQPVMARSEVEGDADWSTKEDQGWPVGRAVALKPLEIGLGSSGEKYLTSDFPETWYDLAANVRDSADATSLVVLSPGFEFVPPPWSGTPVVPPTADTFEVGSLQIFSVYVGGAPPASETLDAAGMRRVAAVGDYPPSGIINNARTRSNAIHIHGPAQICTRSPGNQWEVDTSTTGGTRLQRGRYSFRKLSTAYQTIGRCAIPSDPTTGAGLNVAKIIGDALFLLVKVNNIGDALQAVTVRLMVDFGGVVVTGDPQELALEAAYAYSKHATITTDDAALAAVTQAFESDWGTIGTAWEHAFTQQLTYGRDAFTRGGWSEVTGLEVDLPSTYPAFVELQIKLTASGPDLWAVCPSFGCRYGSRI